MTKLTFRVYIIAGLILSLGFSPILYAHLLPAQHGKLSFVEDGVFMALSLPISAFENLDDDKNGAVSIAEFNNHRADIISRIKTGIVLSEKGEDRVLEGVMLSPASNEGHDKHGKHKESTDADVVQIYVMGKFFLTSTDNDLRFRNSLYGKQASERTFKISATRKSRGQKQKFELTPNSSTVTLFSKKTLSTSSG